MNRPVHLRVSSMGLVLLGGSLGTAARQGLGLALPSPAGFPVTTLGINILGAVLLGILLEALLAHGTEGDRGRTLRLLLGTGFMGGFTTYSTLAVDTATLLGAGDLSAGLLYALGTLVLGGLGTWAGIALGSLLRRGGPQ